MFSKRSYKAELLDDFTLHGQALKDNLDDMVFINHWFGSKTLLIHALNEIYHSYKHYFMHNKTTIADLRMW